MENLKKRFSVIIATYNVMDYVEEAIESVLNQDFDNFELIVVDDCSTDKTREIIEKYKSEKVSIYSTKANTGTAGGPRNIGLEHAKGEYILFLDGDDILFDENVLTKIDKLIGKGEYDLIYLGYQDIGNNNKTRVSNKKNSTKVARIGCDLSFSVSSRCWNSKFLKRIDARFVEGLYYEDEIFSMKTNILANKTTYGEFSVFRYRRNRKGSVMSTPSYKKCSDLYRMLAELVDLFKITPKEYRRYLMGFIKNESEYIPIKIKAMLEALESGENNPIFPKREYSIEEEEE